MDSRPVEITAIPLLAEAPVVLSAEESARAARFRFDEDRMRWTRAHSALRRVLAQATGAPALALRFASGPQGKPFLPDQAGTEFNLSHAGDWALIAISRGVPVGVDIERLRPNIDMAAMLRRLGEAEIPERIEDQLQTWTRREARSKAAGGALFDPPPDNIQAVALQAPPGYAASVALVGFAPAPVYRDFSPSSE
jgi:4'-phosphopantetheinyl transferase